MGRTSNEDPDPDDIRSYGQYCPVTRAVEVLGERWTMLIVRDLVVGATRFNDLARGLPGLSRTLLAKRLRQLERAGIVDHVGDDYLLTEAGRDLQPLVMGLAAWGAAWQFGHPRDHELDPELLMWWVHGRLDLSSLPERRVVIEFAFQQPRRHIWIVNDTGGPSVCTSDPGFDVDVTVESELATMYEVWLGRIDLRRALRAGEIKVHGPTAMVRRVPDILQLSPVADIVAATVAATNE